MWQGASSTVWGSGPSPSGLICLVMVMMVVVVVVVYSVAGGRGERGGVGAEGAAGGGTAVPPACHAVGCGHGVEVQVAI